MNDYREIAKGFDNQTVDMYWNYTATLLNYNQQAVMERPYDEVNVYELVKGIEAERGIRLLNMSELHNDYALAVRSDSRKLADVQSIDDLKKIKRKLNIVVDNEFVIARVGDGLDDLLAYYNIPKRQHYIYAYQDHVDIYKDLRLGQADVALVYKTDHEIDLERLRLLHDDRGFFAPYNLVAMLRNDYAEQYPELVEALNQIADSINNELMHYMLQRYQIDGLSLEQLVDEILSCSNLLEPQSDSAKQSKKSKKDKKDRKAKKDKAHKNSDKHQAEQTILLSLCY